ncbi:MAG: ABC transporter substrate-binding protein [Gammaproteobacteria bacterium]|nr:MAG: ABC transporter substrate-binding protein [Gammaproteobacteria bacterium]
MKRHIVCALLACIASVFATAGQAEPKKSFRIAWTIYVGWMPWHHAAEARIIDKWARRYGLEIEVVQLNDYIESINQYTAGAFDGVTATNMDALTIPAAGGVDTTALIIGDFSNGNDGVVLKGSDRLADIRGRDVHLVELSVSHYLLARALDSVGLAERDVRVVNVSDADIVSAFFTDEVEAAVTWNPQLGEILGHPQAHLVFDSSDIPGEIIDLLVVNTRALEENPDFGRALVGAWYEIMGVLAREDEAGAALRAALGKAAGTDRAGYEAQLATTRFFFDPAEAAAFARDPKLIDTMRKVAAFSFDHGLLGEGARSAEAVGMAFPGGRTLGDAQNIKLRFTDRYMQMAADGGL